VLLAVQLCTLFYMATSVDFMHSVMASGERELSEGAESLLGPSFADVQGRGKFREF